MSTRIRQKWKREEKMFWTKKVADRKSLVLLLNSWVITLMGAEGRFLLELKRKDWQGWEGKWAWRFQQGSAIVPAPSLTKHPRA